MKNSSYVKKCLVVVLALMALCLGVTPAKADPIVYNFYGTASGDLNGTTFDTLPALITIPGDTANVSELSPGSGFWLIDGLTGSIHIPNVVDGTFTDPLYVWCDNGLLQVAFGDSPAGVDLLILAPNPTTGLDTYDLQSNFGPTAPAGAFVSQFAADITILGTSGNILTIEDMYDASFVAVPLPAGVLLLGAGLLRLIGYRRSRKS